MSCGICKHWKSGYCELRNQAVAPYSRLAETCPNFEPGEGPAEAKPQESKESAKTVLEPTAVRTGTILDKLPYVNEPQPKAQGGRERWEITAVKTGPATPLIETAIQLYNFGFNVVPVNKEKRPLVSWDPEKRIEASQFKKALEGATGIAVVGGDVNPWGDKWRLVLIDVDKPSLLEKVPVLREIAENTVVWKTGPRCPKCESKQFEVQEGKLKCKECGSVFPLNEVNQRGLGMMVLIDKGIADKRGFSGTKRKVGEVEFLVRNYQLIPPSLHPTGISYEWVRPLTLEKPFAGIYLLGERELEKLLSELGPGERKQQQAEEVEEKGQLRELSDAEVLRVKEILKNVYVPGYRQSIWLYLSGWGAKAGISPVSVARILELLYHETQDTDGLKTRGSALVYSYGKAGINLELYAEKLREIFGEEPYGLMRGFSQESVKGFSGLQEVVESVLKSKNMAEKEAEEQAVTMITQIGEVFGKPSPFRDSFALLLDRERQIYAIANLSKLICVRARRTEQGFKYLETVLMGAPTKVTVYFSPIRGEYTKFEVTWESKTRPKPIALGPAEKEFLLNDLTLEGLVLHSRLAKDVFSAILEGAILKGFAEIKTEINKRGFYYIDGKITAVNVETELPDKNELRKALEFLNNIAKYYEKTIERFSFIIRWGVIAPFSYAYKQLGKMIRGNYIYGKTRTGKTTQGKIILSMWGTLDTDHFIPATKIDTPARLGEKVNQDTFPIMVNEPAGVLQKEEMVEMIKNAIENLHVRGRFSGGKYRNVPALANIMFTSNKYMPKDDSLLRRFYTVMYSHGDRIPEEKTKEFDREVLPRLKELEPIGCFIANYVLEHGLEDEPIDYAGKILTEAYKYAGLEPPAWLSLSYNEFEYSVEDLTTEEIEGMRSFLLRKINNEFARYVGKVTVETREGGEVEKTRIETTLEERTRIVLEQQLIPWLKGAKLEKEGESVIILGGIMSEISNEVPSITGLKSIAELLGWEYGVIKINGKATRVVTVSLEKFMDFLNPEIIAGGDEKKEG